MEYTEVFKNEDGTEVEIKMKTECYTQDEMNAAISFMAQSSRKFYLQAAEKISSTLHQNDVTTNVTFNTFNIENATNSIIGTQSDIQELGKPGTIICLR